MVHETRNHALVDLEAGGIEKGLFFLYKLSQLLFAGQVNVERSIQESRSGTPCSIFSDRRNGGLLDFGMIGESHVTVRAEHEDPLAVEHDFRALCRRDGSEVWIQSRGHDTVCTSVSQNFLTYLVAHAFTMLGSLVHMSLLLVHPNIICMLMEVQRDFHYPGCDAAGRRV